MNENLIRKFHIFGIDGSYKKDNNTKGVIFDSHCHPTYEIIMVLTGKVVFLIEGRELVALPGSVVVLPPFVYHSIVGDGKGEYERIDLCFEKSTVPAVIREEFDTRVRAYPLFVGVEGTEIARKMQKIICVELCERSYPLFQAELTRLFYMICDGESQGMGKEKSEAKDTCAKIVAYINENIENRISLEDISRSLFLSKSTVCHLFKNRMKTGIKQYILQKKISYATALLRSGVPAGEVAKRIGYENYANFYTVYKCIMGCAPGEIKNQTRR